MLRGIDTDYDGNLYVATSKWLAFMVGQIDKFVRRENYRREGCAVVAGLSSTKAMAVKVDKQGKQCAARGIIASSNRMMLVYGTGASTMYFTGTQTATITPTPTPTPSVVASASVSQSATTTSSVLLATLSPLLVRSIAVVACETALSLLSRGPDHARENHETKKDKNKHSNQK
jgi:hypothetical protein